MGNVNSKEQEIGFSTEFFPSETGECNIAVHTWRPAAGQSVRGVIQLVHGMSEYVRRFQPIAEYFVSLGYVFCGNDHAGHGDSIQQADKKGFFAAENGWNALVDDVMTVHRRLKAEYPEAKQILYGHSMGSFIARACASRYGTEFDAFIFSATAGKNPLLPFAKLAARRRFADGRAAAQPAPEQACFRSVCHEREKQAARLLTGFQRMKRLWMLILPIRSAGSVSAAQHIAICLKVWTRSVEKHGAMPFRMFRFTFLPVTPILSGISAEGRAGYAITL